MANKICAISLCLEGVGCGMKAVLSHVPTFATTWPFTIHPHSHLASLVRLSSNAPHRALHLAEEEVEGGTSTMQGSWGGGDRGCRAVSSFIQ